MEESTIEELRQQLEDRETKLHYAAMYGKELLEKNQVQAEEYETYMDETNKKIESLEQAKYHLQMQLESKEHMEKHYEAELSNASDRTKREVAAVTDRLQLSHANEVKKQKGHINTLKEELDLYRLKESQLQEKVKSLEERLESAESTHNRTFTNMTSCMEEQVSTLAEQLAQIQAEKLLLTDSLKEREEVCKQQTMTISSSSRRLEELQEQNDDQHKQCVSYQRALEECRERLEEKQAELELFRLESQDPNRKGNSLFAEVEVKRQEIEKKYITLKVQHDAMKKRAHFHNQRVQELKLQVANLLQIDDSRVSMSRVKDLQKDLVRARQQNQLLLKKLSELEENKTMQPISNEHTKSGLTYLLEESKKESEKLRGELRRERMMHMASEMKATEYQNKLHDTTSDLDKCKAQLIRLELKISDLKAKSQSGQHPANTQGTEGRLEKIHITTLPKSDVGKTSNVPRPDTDENKENQGDPSAEDIHESDASSKRPLIETNGKVVDTREKEMATPETASDPKEEGNGDGSKQRSDAVEKMNPEELSSTNGCSRKRQIGGTRGRRGVTSNGRGKAVSISDEVQVIGESEDSIDQSLGEGLDQTDRVASPSKAKKSRSKVKMVQVGEGAQQNECKQQ